MDSWHEIWEEAFKQLAEERRQVEVENQQLRELILSTARLCEMIGKSRGQEDSPMADYLRKRLKGIIRESLEEVA